jgi:hypothetical protein
LSIGLDASIGKIGAEYYIERSLAVKTIKRESTYQNTGTNTSEKLIYDPFNQTTIRSQQSKDAKTYNA